LDFFKNHKNEKRDLLMLAGEMDFFESIYHIFETIAQVYKELINYSSL